MKIDLDYLRDHYASLSDEALAEIDRNELVDAARQCYDEEAARRGPLDVEPARHEEDDPPRDEVILEADDTGHDGDPPWLAEAFCACSFTEYHGQVRADEAAQARDALRAAGIPCHVSVKKSESPHAIEYYVMVPSAVYLHAVSVLDRDVFNPQLEEEWRTHLAGLSGDEFCALDPEMFCAGLRDRIQRLTRAYEQEIKRRRR